MDRFVTIASFYSPITANLFKMRLAENGIEAGLMGEGTVAALGWFGTFGNRIEVQVSEFDADMATRLLEQFEAEERGHADDEDFHQPDAPFHGQGLPDDAIRAERHPTKEAAAIRPAQTAPPREQADASHGQLRSDEKAPSTDTNYQACPECKTLVDPGRENCHWCGASMKAVPEPPEEELGDDEHPIVDDAVLEEIKTSDGDDWALSARNFAVFGLLVACFPIANLASLGMLLWIVIHRFEVGPEGRRRMMIAAVIDAVVLLAWLLIVFLVSQTLPDR